MAQLSTVRSSSVKLNGKRGDALIRGPSALQTLSIPPVRTDYPIRRGLAQSLSKLSA
jgi:hypothetical protein